MHAFGNWSTFLRKQPRAEGYVFNRYSMLMDIPTIVGLRDRTGGDYDYKTPEHWKDFSAETTMPSPDLPAEILDCIIDFLHHEPRALQNCCLVAKSWIPPSRRHIFAISRVSIARSPKSWQAMFPDPFTSPTHHARTLVLPHPWLIKTEDMEEGGWLLSFSSVVRLEILCRKLYLLISSMQQPLI